MTEALDLSDSVLALKRTETAPAALRTTRGRAQEVMTPMQDERSFTVREENERVDRAIVGLLIEDQPGRLWAIEEIVREIGDEVATSEAIRRLRAAGLVHQVPGEFVFASRTTIKLWELVMDETLAWHTPGGHYGQC